MIDITIEDFLDLFTETYTIEIFDLFKGKYIFRGFACDIPLEKLVARVVSVDWPYGEAPATLTINIDTEKI